MAALPAIGFEIKDLFFDRAAVQARVDRAKGRVLSRGAAFVRSDARRSIRKTKKASKPGQPPRSHSSEPNMRTILFAYDRRRQTAIIGPVRLPRGGFAGGKTAPQALEEGAGFVLRKTILLEKKTGTRITRRNAKRAKLKPEKLIVVRPGSKRIAPRSFMRPALAKNEDKIARLWKDSI